MEKYKKNRKKTEIEGQQSRRNLKDNNKEKEEEAMKKKKIKIK